MRAQLRIVAGSLRGRKLTFVVDPGLRPTPDRVREALFSILGNAVPDRRFFDLFAGTGVIGMEALSRGATLVEFVERDLRTASQITNHLRAFSVADVGVVHRADVYRWIDHWHAPAEPVNLFLGPPFPDLEQKQDPLMRALGRLQEKAALGSVLVLQSERTFDPAILPDSSAWDQRVYGRNRLSIWVKEELVLNP